MAELEMWSKMYGCNMTGSNVVEEFPLIRKTISVIRSFPSVELRRNLTNLYLNFEATTRSYH